MAISTVTGAVGLDDLGKTLMHEHLVVGSSGWELDPNPKLSWQDELLLCVDRIEELKAAGYRTLVDPCPNDMGRDVKILFEAAARTNFNIICATGFYTEEQGGNRYWVNLSQWDPDFVDRLADLMISELTDGVKAVGVRPGVIKLSTAHPPMTDYERKVFTAGAKASLATGAPIMTHTDAVLGDEQAALLISLGVAPHKIIIGHCCGSSDHSYHRKIIDSGVYVGFDRFGIEMLAPDESRVESILKLLREGLWKQLIVSHDTTCSFRGNIDVSSMLDLTVHQPLRFERVIAPRLLQAGVSKAELEGLLTENPKRYFAGEPF